VGSNINKMGYLKLTFLGTGTSQGVPVIGCPCEVCHSKDSKDKRLRTSALIKTDKGTQITIDAGPDFREQMLKYDVTYLDAILVTHSHRDHIGGLDDVRSYNYLQKMAMPVYCNRLAGEGIKEEFAYAFASKKYPGLPEFDLRTLNADKDFSFNVKELTINPIEVMHASLPILAYRIGSLAYITDAKTIEEKQKKKLFGVKTLIVNALRKEEHFSHFNLNEALQLISELKPQRAYLTHISHFFGFQQEIQQELPENVFLSYDGLQIEEEY
jgi:phosphoribosyl 1,2-cyclic phosphate phosphodiesterase